MVEDAGNIGGNDRITRAPVTSDDTSHGGGGNAYIPLRQRRQRKKKSTGGSVNVELSPEARKMLERRESGPRHDETAEDEHGRA